VRLRVHVARGWGSSLFRLWGFGVALFGGLGAARRPEVSPPFLSCFSKQQPQFLGEQPFSGYSRSCPLPCLPCLYTTCAKELLRPTVGLLCLCQGLWIRTRQVLCCPRAGTRWRTFCTQRYSKVSGTQRYSFCTQRSLKVSLFSKRSNQALRPGPPPKPVSN
jgi:hypothetical protein